MKLKNTTDFPDHFLRRMVSWCCKELELPVRKVRNAAFGNRTNSAYSGHAWYSMRIHISIGPEKFFPTGGHLYPGRTSEAYRTPMMNDRTEALVSITAHELTHLRTYDTFRSRPMIRQMRRGIGSERQTQYEMRRLTELFRANREVLLANWNAVEEKAESPKVPAVEKRAAKVEADLARWTSKLKLAQTKIRKLRQRQRYYERKQAACRDGSQ